MEPRERILKGAEELFFGNGIKSITMDDIAKHLGISKKTIYLSFADKDEIVHTLMKEALKADTEMFDEISKSAENFVAEVFMMMKQMNSILTKVNPSVFFELQKYYPNTWKLFSDFKIECVCRHVEVALEKGIKQGIVRADLNPKLLSRLRMEEVELGFDPEVFPPDKFKVLEVQVALLEHFLYGVCTLRGHKLINKYKEVIEEE